MKSILNENAVQQSSLTNQILISQSREQNSISQTNKIGNSLQSKILYEKQQEIIETARKQFQNFEFQLSILSYKKALYLSEKVEVYNELAQVYIEVCDISMAIKVYQKSLSMKKDEVIEEKLNKLLLYKGMNCLETGEFSSFLKTYYESAKLEKFKKKSDIEEKIKLEEEEQERIRIQKEMELNQKNKKKKKKQSQDKKLEEEEQIKQEQTRIEQIQKLKGIKIKLTLPIHEKLYLQGQIICDLHIYLGISFLSINYPNFASADIQKSLEFEPNFIDSLLLQAKILKMQDRKNEANEIFWKIYNINNTHPEIKEFIKIAIPEAENYFQQARKNLLENDPSKAMFLVNKGLKIYPTHTNLLLLRGFLARRLENYEESLCDLELAYRVTIFKFKCHRFEIRNQIGHTYNEMGRHLFSKQKYEEARTIFTEALLFKADDWGIIINRGDCYFELKQDDQALEDYLKALEIAGKNEEVTSRLCNIFIKLGTQSFNNSYYQKAISEFTQAIEFNPKSDLALVQRGKCQIEVGAIHLARKDFQTAFQINPENQGAKKYISLLEKAEKSNFSQNYRKQELNF